MRDWPVRTPGVRGFAIALLAALAIGWSSAPAQAQVLRRLTDLNPDDFIGWSVDDEGSLAVAVWRADPLGTNPDRRYQIVRWDLPSGVLTQLTNFTNGMIRNVSISDDGEWVVFDSSSDPVGQNGDGTLELFRIRKDGTAIVQLTNDDLLGGGRAECPEISGSGNRILFYGTYDPAGTNPDHLTQLFVIDLVTPGIAQLTHGDSGIHVPYTSDGRCYPAISDDGERIVFSSSADLTGENPSGTFQTFKIGADGLGLEQLSDGGVDAYAWGISGNGERVLVVTEPDGVGEPVRVIHWDGSHTATLAPGLEPTIIDNGRTVYYSNWSQVYSMSSSGGPPLLLTSLGSGSSRAPVVSGSGNRIVYIEIADTCPTSPQLMAIDSASTYMQQLTSGQAPFEAYEPAISGDGSRVVYKSDVACGIYDLFRIDTDGSDPVAVLQAGDFWTPEITADGETIVFMSWLDLAGTGTCSARDVFRVQADGTGLAQLSFSDDCQEAAQPSVAADGSVVVFQSHYGSFGYLPGDLFSIPLEGGAAVPIVNDGDGAYKRPTVSADGAWTAWQAIASGGIQVWRGRTDGSFVEQLTADPVLSSSSPDISGDGRFVAFESYADFLGTNVERNKEIFVYDALSGTMAQLTSTEEGQSRDARIGDDGEYVYFLSNSPSFGPIPGASRYFPYRVHRATGVIERAGTLSHVPSTNWSVHPYLNVDANGGRAVFTSTSTPTGEPTGAYDLWLADFETPATIHPGAQTPTVLDWDRDPRALHYDVIRGDVANLAAGFGATVDLGTVVCLENDTFNTSTAGAEADAGQPAPGQAFFFLRRWTQGMGDGPGSYGRGSSGGERFASAGDCAQ